MGEWTNRELDMLALMMGASAKKFSKTKKNSKYAAHQQVAADILRVKRGDLRRGPFSPILLRRASEKEWGAPSIIQYIFLPLEEDTYKQR